MHEPCFSKGLGGLLGFLVGALALSAGCKQVIDLANRPCEQGSCLDGYVCHPERFKCVPQLNAGCDGDGVCPRDISTGTSCSTPGAYIPCEPGGARDCRDGCRTCLGDDGWSACSEPLDCKLGQVNSCSSCDDDCSALAEVDEVSCAAGNDGFSCQIIACNTGFHNVDGDATNGCEYACTPTDPPKEKCDDRDNDCDGLTDPPDAVGCETHYRDRDNDGYGTGRPEDSACTCGPTEAFPTPQTGDCDDTPQSEGGCGAFCSPERRRDICDSESYDNDCDGVPDAQEPNAQEDPPEQGTAYYIDRDGDTYGEAGSQPRTLCAPQDDYTATRAGDCDDENDQGGNDLCQTYYLDADGDEYAAEGAPEKCLCGPVGNYRAKNLGDCDDTPRAEGGCGVLCAPDRSYELCDDNRNNLCSADTSSVDQGCTIVERKHTWQLDDLQTDPVNAIHIQGSTVYVGLAGEAGVNAFQSSDGNTFSRVSSVAEQPVRDIEAAFDDVFWSHRSRGSPEECYREGLSDLHADDGKAVCTQWYDEPDDDVAHMVAAPLEVPSRLYFVTDEGMLGYVGEDYDEQCEDADLSIAANEYVQSSPTALAAGARNNDNRLFVATDDDLYHCRGFNNCYPNCSRVNQADDLNGIQFLRTYRRWDPVEESFTNGLVLAVGTRSNGAAIVYLNNNGSVDTSVSPPVDRWTQSEGELPSDDVRDFARDPKRQRHYWATADGLAVHDLQTGSWHTWEVGNNITALAPRVQESQDRRVLWVGTSSGVVRILLE